MARGHLTRSPSGHLTRQTGRSPDSPSGSTFTLAQGLADFLVSGQARGLSPKTLDWYRMIGVRFAACRTSRGADPALGAMSVAEARAFVVSLQEAGLAPSSVAGFVRGLRAVSAWCAAEGLVAEDPLRRLPRPRVPTRLSATLGPVELERLLAVASRRDRLIIALFLDTGLRLSELAGLRTGDLLPECSWGSETPNRARIAPVRSAHVIAPLPRRPRPRPSPRLGRALGGSRHVHGTNGTLRERRALEGVP